MKILSLDGGGVFGFAQERILRRSGCADKFDAFVGTSIGGALASAYAMNRQALMGEDFFNEWMPRIFSRCCLRGLNPFIPKYSDRVLNEALKSIFQGAYFGSAVKPLFVNAVNVRACRLKVFSSLDNDDGSWPAWRVVRCSTAAPTYFRTCDGYCDGGVMVNNPAMAGVASAISSLSEYHKNISILSIGTGDRSDRSYGPKTKLGWGIWILQALLNGASNSMNDYYVRSLQRGNIVKKYKRIQFPANPKWQLDSLNGMREAMLAWEPLIQEAVNIVKEF